MASISLCSILLFTITFWSTPVHGEEELPTGLTLLGQDNYDVVAQKNSKLLLNCSVATNVSQFGPLEISWYKDNVKLQLKENRIQLGQNGSLYFKRVLNRKKKNITDEGLYECHVKNNIGTVVARRVRVKVKGIAKSYIQEPEPQTVVAGGVARFQCRIKAEPPALYTWLKDQKEQITANNRFIIIPSGILQILDVRKSDEGFYSCSTTPGGLHNLPDQVEHIEWKPSAEAELTVIQDAKPRPPVIVAKPQDTVVENGQSSILECLVDGNPKPKVTWARRDGKPISDRSSMAGGNLKLLEVIAPGDSAVYICRASSPGNEDITAEAKLTVQTRPVITEPARSIKYPAARLVRFPCKAKGIPKPKIKWLKDGKPLKESTSFSKNDDDLIIPGSTVKDSGYYQCIAYNALGYVTNIVRLKVVAEGNRPGPPQNVRVVTLSSDLMTVEWDPSEEKPCCPVLAYSVDIVETSNGEQNSHVVHGGTQKEIDHLEPFTNYSIFVRAYSITAGASEKSEGITVVTKEDVPDIPPMIRLSSTTPRSISVEWEEIEESKRNGVIRGYMIYYMKDGDKTKKFVEAKGTATSHMITGLEPSTLYRVRVMANTSAGYPHFNDEEWPWVKYKTPSTGKLPSAPVDLHIVPINMTALNVTWTHEANGNPAIGFTLIIRRMVEQGEQQIIHIPDPKTKLYTLTNLENNTYYEISLVANNAHGSSGPIIEEYLTSDEPLPAAPQNLRVLNVTSSALQLTWTQPNSSVVVTQYQVRVCRWNSKMIGGVEYQPTILKKTRNMEAWIRDLEPYTDYKLDVRALSRTGHQSTWSKPVSKNTLEDLPSEPRELQAFITSEGIRVEWKPPAKPNGNITKYIVMYKVFAMQTQEGWKILNVNGSLTSMTIDLQTGMYKIRLKACTKIGSGPPSSDVTIRNVYPTEQPGVLGQGNLEDQKLGIILGVTIGIICIIICIIIVTLRNKCFSNGYPLTQPARFHGNGHIPGRGNGHATHIGEGLNDYQLEICTPMLSTLPGENEHSDSKGCGSGNIIVTPNGTRVNGYVPFKNGMRNGHMSNGHVTAYISYTDSKQSEETRGLIAAMLAASDGSHTSEEPTVVTKTPDRDSLLDGIDRSLEETEEEKSGENTSHLEHLPPTSTSTDIVHSNSEAQDMEMAGRQQNQHTSQQESASSELFTHSAHSVAAAANTGQEGDHQGHQEALVSSSLGSPHTSSLRTSQVSCVDQLSTSDCKHCQHASDPLLEQGKCGSPEEGTTLQSQAKPHNLSESAMCQNKSHQPVQLLETGKQQQQHKNLKNHKNQEKSSHKGKPNGITSHYKAALEREKSHLKQDSQGDLSYYYNGRCYQRPPPPPYPHKVRRAPQLSRLPQECDDSNCWHSGCEKV